MMNLEEIMKEQNINSGYGYIANILQSSNQKKNKMSVLGPRYWPIKDIMEEKTSWRDSSQIIPTGAPR